MEPLKVLQTKDAVAEALREEIFSGALPDGAELVQEQLAERLGVSRMPVREALQQLELEGILQRLPNRHMRVAGVTPRTVEQSFSMLSAVELEMAATALREGLSLDPVSEAVSRYQEAAARNTDCAARELLVHSSFADCLQNPCLSRMHRLLSGGHFAYTLFHRSRPAAEVLAQLESVSRALMQQDFPVFSNALSAYFTAAAQDALTAIGGTHV